MPNRTEVRPAKAVLRYATGSLPLLRLFSTPLIEPQKKEQTAASPARLKVDNLVVLHSLRKFQ